MPGKTCQSFAVKVPTYEDAVLVGDVCFALVNAGMFRFRFTSVYMLSEGPPMIEFQTLTTMGRGGSVMSITTTAAALRLPVARSAGDLMLGLGIILGAFFPILALGAWLLGRAQRRKA